MEKEISDYFDSISNNKEYTDIIDIYGANPTSKEQYEEMPKNIQHLFTRNIFFAERNLNDFIQSMKSGRQHSIVTGIGPSGPLHIGNIIQLIVCRAIQDMTNANLYITISDDQKFVEEDYSMQSIQDYTIQNLKEIIAFGFNPSKTTIIIDSVDADLIYPVSLEFSSRISYDDINTLFGQSDNIGESFYHSVQISQILLPQLIYGKHSTLVVNGFDQDPYIRLANDIVDKSKFEIKNISSIISKHLPSISNEDKSMSSSENMETIHLEDEYQDIEKKILESSINSNDYVNVDSSLILLYWFFESDDEELMNLINSDISKSELNNIVTERIYDFIEEQRARRQCIDSIEDEYQKYKLTKTEINSALTRIGYSTELRFD